MRHVFGAVFEHGAWYAEYLGISLILRDTSNLGGSHLDWQLSVGISLADVEIKMPGKESDLTSGEAHFFSKSEGLNFVVTSEQEFLNLVYVLADPQI